MTEIETLIRRELHWLSDGIVEEGDLAARIIKASRRRRLRQYSLFALFTFSVSALSIFGYIGITNLRLPESEQVAITSPLTENSNSQFATEPEKTSTEGAQNQNVISAYPLSWEDSIGDLSAISKPAGVGGTLGGLTANSLNVSWSKCRVGYCPTTWTLNVVNKTEDIISAAPSLMVYVDHQPLISTSRPLTVFPGAKANLVFSFPELADMKNVGDKASWQWNWFLTAAR
jgi:hypothetical protein